MRKLLDYLVRKGLRRGVGRGETLWLAVGAAAFAARFALRTARRKQEVVFSEKLGVGKSLVISHLPPKRQNGRGEGPSSQP